MGMPVDYMTRDQRFASTRTDVLTYETEPLGEDVTIAGSITPVSCTYRHLAPIRTLS